VGVVRWPVPGQWVRGLEAQLGQHFEFQGVKTGRYLGAQHLRFGDELVQPRTVVVQTCQCRCFVVAPHRLR
jgi:hypothetical protein